MGKNDAGKGTTASGRSSCRRARNPANRRLRAGAHEKAQEIAPHYCSWGEGNGPRSVPLHTHPRASEVALVLGGSVLVGFADTSYRPEHPAGPSLVAQKLAAAKTALLAADQADKRASRRC